MVNDLISYILPSIEHFRVGGYWIAFFAAIIETTVGIGLIIPGSTIILFLGALSARGYLDTIDLIWFAALGAIVGDNVNYVLGTKYGNKWLKDGFWLLKSDHIKKAKHFMDEHGAKSVFLGRFIPSVKEVVPFIAGSLRMNRRTFMLWNVLGAIGWGCEWVLAGFIFAQSLTVAQIWISRAGLLFAFLLLLGIVFSLLKWLITRKGKAYLAGFASVCHSIKEAVESNSTVILWMKKHPRIISFLKARLDTKSFSGLSSTIFILLFGYVLALLGGIVEDLITSDSIIAVDIRIANLCAALRTEALTDIFSWVTLLGKSEVILFFITISISVLWLWQKKYCIFPLLLAVTGSTTFTYLGKLAFHRPRPETALYAEQSFSFPSGHATIAVAFYGYLAYLLIRSVQSWSGKVNIFFATALLIIAIGFSRIYLGVHYVSDVWSGYLVGAMWLIIATSFTEWLIGKKYRDEPKSHTNTVQIISFALMLTAVLFYVGFSLNYHPPLASLPIKSAVVVSKSTDIFTTDQMKYTETLIGSKQEPINTIIIAKDDSQVISAFQVAGWTVTDTPAVSSFFSAMKALIAKEPHPSAPISPSFWNAKIQNLSFAKVAGTNWLINARHAKIWRTNFVLNNGNYIFVAMVNANNGFTWGVIPQISPDLDTAREQLYQDLDRAGEIESHQKETLVPPLVGKNFIGDHFFTDGKVYIYSLP